MADKEFIEKIRSLTFLVRGTPSERRVAGFREVESAEEIHDDSVAIPDGYTFTDKRGRFVAVVHGDQDRRQVEEIVAEKQGD